MVSTIFIHEDVSLVPFDALPCNGVVRIVTYDQVHAGNMEAIQILACRLGFKYILVNDVSGSSCVIRGAKANLSDSAIFAKDVIHILSCDLMWETSE